MGPLRGRVLGFASLLLLALAGCSNPPDAAPSGPREAGITGVDLQIRGVTEFVPPDSAQEPPALTCDGQDEPVADCVAENRDAEQLVLVGPEPNGGTYVLGPVIVDATDVQQAAAVSPSMGSMDWVVEVQLSPAGTSAFAAATQALVGRQIAVVLDGVVLSAPTVQDTITSGAVQIQGSFDEAEAQALASHVTRQTDASP